MQMTSVNERPAGGKGRRELFCSGLMIARLQETARTAMTCGPQAQGPILSPSLEINYSAENGGKSNPAVLTGPHSRGANQKRSRQMKVGQSRWSWRRGKERDTRKRRTEKNRGEVNGRHAPSQ
ncbi:hypothetical protein QQF64_016866 [Cirrhinus molitorella]|uniref:Uncharacterized protein n=1 Tax=Cirrhinus molitorella TaxID=172907 RepID=A0ABR3LSP6_9TELE